MVGINKTLREHVLVFLRRDLYAHPVDGHCEERTMGQWMRRWLPEAQDAFIQEYAHQYRAGLALLTSREFNSPIANAIKHTSHHADIEEVVAAVKEARAALPDRLMHGEHPQLREAVDLFLDAYKQYNAYSDERWHVLNEIVPMLDRLERGAAPGARDQMLLERLVTGKGMPTIDRIFGYYDGREGIDGLQGEMFITRTEYLTIPRFFIDLKELVDKEIAENGPGAGGAPPGAGGRPGR